MPAVTKGKNLSSYAKWARYYRHHLNRWFKGKSGRNWKLKQYYPGVISVLASRNQPIIDFEEPPTGMIGAPTYLMRTFILTNQGAFTDVMRDFNVLPKRTLARRQRRR